MFLGTHMKEDPPDVSVHLFVVRTDFRPNLHNKSVNQIWIEIAQR